MKQYWVYILTNDFGKLYIGITNDLERRMYEHRNKVVPGYTQKNDISRLVYFEEFSDAYSAIVREKQLKGWFKTVSSSVIATIISHSLLFSVGLYLEKTLTQKKAAERDDVIAEHHALAFVGGLIVNLSEEGSDASAALFAQRGARLADAEWTLEHYHRPAALVGNAHGPHLRRRFHLDRPDGLACRVEQRDGTLHDVWEGLPQLGNRALGAP